jgi:hypothetical protein
MRVHVDDLMPTERVQWFSRYRESLSHFYGASQKNSRKKTLPPASSQVNSRVMSRHGHRPVSY